MTRRSNVRHIYFWSLLVVLLVLALGFGARPESKPVTPQQRVDSLATQLRCPTCSGLSVAESESPLAQSSREEIARQVAEGKSNKQIKAFFVSRYGENALLSPSRRGVSGVVWALPVGVGVIAFFGLVTVVVRWRRSSFTETELESPFELHTINTSSRARHGSQKTQVTWHVRSWIPAWPVLANAGAGMTGIRAKRLWPAMAMGTFAFAVIAVLTYSTGDRLRGENTTGSVAADSNTLLARASELTAKGRADEALKTYDQVLKLDPANVQALAYRGWLIRLAGLPAEGLKSINQAVSGDPRYPDARFFLGFIYLHDRNDPAAAIPEFEAFLGNNPPPQMVPLVQKALEDARAQAAKR